MSSTVGNGGLVVRIVMIGKGREGKKREGKRKESKGGREGKERNKRNKYIVM